MPPEDGPHKVTPRLEPDLSEVRSRLESILTAGGVGTWEFDPVNDIVRADRNLAEMFGVSEAVAAGGPIRAYLQAIHDDDRDRVVHEIGQALRAGDRYDAEYRLFGGGGVMRWVMARGRIERDAEGRAIRLPGVVIDITRQRQVEEQLSLSEGRRQLALDSGGLGAWHIDPKSNHLSSDDRFRLIFHGSTSPITYEEAFAAIHPDDRQRIRDGVAAAVRPENPAPYAEEYRVIHPDGSTHWVFGKGRANFQETSAGRQLTSFDGTVIDITARRDSEIDLALRATETDRLKRLYDTVLTNAADFIYTFDLDGRFTYINKALLDLLHKSLPEVVGKNFFDLNYPHELAAKFQRQIQQVIETQQTVRDQSPDPFASSGDRFYEYIFVPVIGRNGETEAVSGSTRDITEQVRIESELRHVAARLSDGDRRKNEFLASLAHELRNPLAPIRTGLEVMRLAKDDPAIVEEIRGTMERQAQQMVRLIDDLLEVSRITQGKLELRKCAVSMADVIRSAVEAARPFVDEANHQLTVSLPDFPIIIEADPNRLAQVISNLINNSSKYTRDGGKIDLSVRCQGDTVLVSVKDNGVGIPAHLQTQIFEMFMQIDRPLEKGYKGLGIGLTLVQRLVEMHGGKVSVQSEGVNRGSEFTVSLPFNSELDQSASAVDESIPAQLPKRRLLVVDDNSDAARMLSLAVKIMGNDVALARDGVEAVEVAEKFRPDVILMDIGMPRMNGYEAATHIRKQPWGRSIVLVALTGWGQEEDKRRADEAGFDFHLVKPAEPSDLQQLLAKLPT